MTPIKKNHGELDPENTDIQLRDVILDDLLIFFEDQLDAEANHMAAFTRKDPTDQDAFNAHWTKIMSDESVKIKTILLLENVAGYVLKYVLIDNPEISYWISKQYWGRGIATQALSLFIEDLDMRPLYARAAKDNLASIRVLEKCGFQVTGGEKGFANARGKEIDEVALILR